MTMITIQTMVGTEQIAPTTTRTQLPIRSKNILTSLDEKDRSGLKVAPFTRTITLLPVGEQRNNNAEHDDEEQAAADPNSS